MEIDREQFVRTSSHSKFHQKLRQSLLPFKSGEIPGDRRANLESLHSAICSGSYYPSIPRGYIVHDKHQGVARIVPVLAYADMCVYYFCIRQLEDEIAVNRIKGTFSGWALGNPVRTREKQEQEETGRSGEAEPYPYSWYGTFDPVAWTRNWQEFQREVYHRALRSEATTFIKFDVANVYDSINLDLLERKLRTRVTAAKSAILDLLFVLLRSWNRSFEGYGPKTVGLPQDEFSDCSRLLANFYLQDYDAVLRRICSDVEGEYLRYTDDQIVMTKTSLDGQRILFEASIEAHKIGLNINSGKVTEFRNRDHFNYYWAFDIMGHLSDEPNQRGIQRAAELFADRIQREKMGIETQEWRKAMVIRRLVNVGIDRIGGSARDVIMDELLTDATIATVSVWMLKRLRSDLRPMERQRLEATIDRLLPVVPFNAFPLTVLKCYGEALPAARKTLIDSRLRNLAYESYR